MKIDQTVIESLQVWGRTWTSGRPIKLEFRSNEQGQILCDVYTLRTAVLSELHPVATTNVSTVKEEL